MSVITLWLTGRSDNCMVYILFALFLFCLSVTAHIFFCRRNTRPGLYAKVYIIIALILIGVYAAGVYGLGKVSIPDGHSLWGLPFKITAGVIFILLVPIYLCFYTLTQLMSPSKKILLTIARRGELSYSEIVSCVEEEDFIGTRLSDLCACGCATFIDGRYRLTPQGQKIAMTLDIMQCVLGRDRGG